MNATQTIAHEFKSLYADAHAVLRAARLGRSRLVVRAEVTRILDTFEEDFPPSEATYKAGRSLRRWARELEANHLLMAEVHLDRAAVALGVRASEAAAELEDEEDEEEERPARKRNATQHLKARRKATSRPEAPSQAVPALYAPLNDKERALVLKLPGPDAPLKGATELAGCWGGSMSPTSARGRYSRLANKLRDAHGRDVLLRGQGRYGRAG